MLPFADHTPDASLAHFCGGLRDEIVHGLPSLKSLRVLAAEGEAAADDRGAAVTRRDAALVISGSVRAERRRPARHDAARRRRQRLLPVVGIR